MSSKDNATQPTSTEETLCQENVNPPVDPFNAILVSKPVQDSSPDQDPSPNQLREIPSFPRPPDSCFVQQYAPLTPKILLPLHFHIPKTLAQIFAAMEEFLKDMDFTTCTSSWRGKINPGEYECECVISVYKSRTDSGHIIEAQNLNRGDGFAFGDFYNNLKKALA